MKRLLLAFLLIFGINSAQAQVITGVETQERVVKLPEDAGNWHVSVFGSPNDAKFQEIQAWFDTDPALRKLRSRTHYHPIATNDPMFSRYAAVTPRTPCIRLQSSDGTRVYEVSGPNVPMTPHALTSAMNAAIFRRCPDGNCNPQPQPAPVEPAPVEPNVSPFDTMPDSTPESDFSWLIAILAGLGGAGGGVASWWKSQYFDQA